MYVSMYVNNPRGGRASVLSGTRRTVIVILVYFYSAWATMKWALQHQVRQHKRS